VDSDRLHDEGAKKARQHRGVKLAAEGLTLTADAGVSSIGDIQLLNSEYMIG
jgi:hypothetical protein